MIAEFYQWALFIWLFAIIYPDGQEDPKVQDVVQRITNYFSHINFGDSVMSCLCSLSLLLGQQPFGTKTGKQSLPNFGD